jgi:hypothetical protein
VPLLGGMVCMPGMREAFELILMQRRAPGGDRIEPGCSRRLMECLWRQLQRQSQEQRTLSWRALEASAGEAQAVKMSEMSAGKREGVMYLISNQPGA